MNSENSNTGMGFMEHLKELRKRIFYIAIALTLGALVTYNFSQEIFALLTEQFHKIFIGENLIGTNPAEAFVLKIKVALFSGALLMSPVVFWQLWQFIAPGLYDQEKKLVFPFVFAATILFLGGVVFAYKMPLPLALEFFKNEYTSIAVTPAIKINEHITFVVQVLLAFGLIFELPLFSFFLGKFGILTSKSMIASWRGVVVGAFVVSAVLTPPDVISQCLMAFPLLFLYLLSIYIVKAVEKKDSAELSAVTPN